MSEARLTNLEVKIAFQEHTIQQLDEVVQQLSAQVDRLQRELSELREEHAASLPPLENPKPPHW